MAKLALYDKNEGKDDWKDNVFYRQDYIYSNNMKTRFYVFFGCVILSAFYFLHMAAFQDVDIFSIDYRIEAIRLLVFFAVVLVGYTIIGTVLYTARYVQKQKRIEKYFELLDELDDITAPESHEQGKTDKVEV